VHFEQMPYTMFRNAYIRQRFHETGTEKHEAIYCELQAEYGLSRSMIEKIVRGER
jgi:hypothetical protein